jgi:hypothetical protein
MEGIRIHFCFKVQELVMIIHLQINLLKKKAKRCKMRFENVYL